MRSTLRRLLSRKSGIAESDTDESTSAAAKKPRPEFKPRPDSILEYTHDALGAGLQLIVKSINAADADVHVVAKDFDEIADLLRIHAVHEEGLAAVIKDSESAKGASSDLLAKVLGGHDAERKEVEGIRDDLRALPNDKSKQGGEGEDGSKSEENDDANKGDSSALADIRAKVAEFSASQTKRLETRRQLHKKLIPELFTPVGVAAKNMKRVLDADRSEFDVFLRAVTQYILGTERTGRVRQLIDAIQRTSSTKGYTEYVKYLSEAVTAEKERLWTKLCSLGYDEPLAEAESPDETPKAPSEPRAKRVNKQRAGRRSVRARLHTGDTVAVRDPLTNERRTGVVQEIVSGGTRLKLKVMQSSELYNDDLVLTLYVNKGDCKKVVTRETWDYLLQQQTAKEEPIKEEPAAEEAKKEQAVTADEPAAKKGDQGAAAKDEGKTDEEYGETKEEHAKKEKPVEEVQVSAEVEEEQPDLFPVISLLERALSLSIEDLRERVTNLDAGDAEAVAEWGEGFSAVSRCIAAREELQDDEFVARFIGKELKGEWREERRYDATQRKALSKLLSSEIDEAAVKKLRSDFEEWAEDHVAHLGREAKYLRSRKHREGFVQKHMSELVQRKPDLFERDIATFVAKQLESFDLDAADGWREALAATLQ